MKTTFQEGQLLIRPMTEKDLPQVCRIEKINFSDPWSREGFLEALSSEQTLFLVCEAEGEIAGYCGAYCVCGEADITNVSVDPSLHNRHIAFKMLSELLFVLKEQGVDAYTLEVRVSNKAAIHLYEKLGFIEEGIRPHFYDHPKEDALIMWKR